MSKKNRPVSAWPDQHHFLRLQEALWDEAGSRASLMVGAGLSRNAQPSPGAGIPFPKWSELAAYMESQLYPRQQNTDDQAVCGQRPARSPERIASEYEVTFGRAALDDLIRKRVPDRGHEPGLTHERLLRLPWRDVFTTNYDTLLERTSVAGRSYHPVTTVEELTRATPPRIIKLHGSFGTGARLIATEEDYRTYPDRFAPFVNTVRQALLENSLVLIGFSGEDRNFLQWTGWVRDELGPHHCPIYLAVTKPLDGIQRSLLRERGVTPIDLAGITGTNHSVRPSDDVLLSDFAVRLWEARRRAEMWKIDMSHTEPRRSGPLDPARESKSSSENADRTAGKEDSEIDRVIRRWRQERLSYPGWMVAPAPKRAELWHSTVKWIEPSLRASSDRSPVDGVLLLNELNWRLDVALAPSFTDWIDRVEDALRLLSEQVLPEEREGIDHNLQADPSVTDAWGSLVLSMVRAAREKHDASRWNEYIDKLGRLTEKCPHLADRYHYERALWHLAHIDRGRVRDLLAEWAPTTGAPRGMIWKAGVLAEIGQLQEAKALLRDALRAIRRATQGSQGRNVELLSMEGWCSYLLYYVEPSVDFNTYAAVKDEFELRWRELGADDCDPWRTQEYFSAALNKTRPSRPKAVERWPAFDPGTWRTTRKLTHGGVGPWLPAFGCLRWAEEVGLPTRTRSLFGVAQGEVIRAANWVERFLPIYSVSILVRMGAVKVLQENEVVSRSRVAEMDREDVDALWDVVLAAVVRESQFLRSQARPWLESPVLSALIEVGSRVTVRLDRDGLEKSFGAVMGLYIEWCGEDVQELASGVAAWFRRLYEAADDDVLAVWLPVVLDSPLPHEAGEQATESWRDPLDGFRIGALRDGGLASAEAEGRIRSVVERLLAQGRETTGRRREDVVWRLASMARADLLTEEERQKLGALVWADHTAMALPRWRNLVLGDYASLPAPEGVDVRRRMKRELLGRATAAAARAKSATKSFVIGAETNGLLDVGLATKTIVNIPDLSNGVLEWDEEEVESLWAGLIGWWEKTRSMMWMAKRRQVSFGEDDRVRANAVAVEMFLVRVKVARVGADRGGDWKEVKTIVDQARKVGVELAGALPYVLIQRPGEGEWIEKCVVQDLAVRDGRRAAAAARAVRHWAYLVAADKVDLSVARGVKALADRVAFRRVEGARWCIRELAALLVDKGNIVSGESVDRLVAGLDGWEEAVAAQTEESDECGIPPEERPDLREAVGVLVNALSIWWGKRRADRPLPAAVGRLMRNYSRDPLPEVRRAVSESRWRYW